jgi:hypothetical protein
METKFRNMQNAIKTSFSMCCRITYFVIGFILSDFVISYPDFTISEAFEYKNLLIL